MKNNIFKMLPELHTKRLLLRKVEYRDAEDIFSFSSDPDVVHHMRWYRQTSIEETLERFIYPVLDSYERGTSADWAICLKEEGRKVIGTCAFVDWTIEKEYAEVGFIMHKGYWGRGIATEALSEVIRFGCADFGFKHIIGICDKDNVASQKVMMKAGMKMSSEKAPTEYIKGEYRDSKKFIKLCND